MSAIAIAAAVASVVASGPEVQAVRLEATQVLALARRADSNGDVSVAEEAYRALRRDPNPDVRAEAQFRHGMLLARTGKLERAAEIFRQLLDERPGATRARLELAGLLGKMGDTDAALRELRAAQASRLPAAVARLVDRYSDALRSGRPIGASIEIALAPDSNISRSTRSNTLGTVFGDFEIADGSKARSGLGLALRGQAYRRIGLGGDSALLVRLSGSADLYRQSRFDDFVLDLAAGPELQLGRSRLSVEVGAAQRWFGLKLFTRSLRLGASVRRPLGSTTQVRLSAAASLADNRNNRLQDGKNLSAGLSVEHALSADMGVALNLSGERFLARDAGYSTTGWRAGILAWRDVGRATLTGGIDFGQLHADDRLALFPEKRQDRYSRLSFGATWRQFSFGGFAPVTRLAIERNRSTIEFYDYRRTRTEIGLARAF